MAFVETLIPVNVLMPTPLMSMVSACSLEKIYEENITGRVQDTHKLFIAYWDCIRLALLTFGVDIYTTLTQGFWP